jgi:hypothetical protein
VIDLIIILAFVILDIMVDVLFKFQDQRWFSIFKPLLKTSSYASSMTAMVRETTIMMVILSLSHKKPWEVDQ